MLQKYIQACVSTLLIKALKKAMCSRSKVAVEAFKMFGHEGCTINTVRRPGNAVTYCTCICIQDLVPHNALMLQLKIQLATNACGGSARVTHGTA